ncbi:MAG: phosphate ABC transporter permease subunit PstC [Chloroflexi bacterium]|nr:phosphate ABC transporter permease subunit PstC [Chloroflexota bacterium]MCY3582415.1 phosphate ABC transporter permease subunit PstC [Chloroflexota bacterium]MXX83551.1 phosphate ABC transporter permease subunit PstC [Chloroflexota bacterium]MYC55055.1 phosphate ABC transporter permease subunit PstC [Chloroflexota bacterium]
MPDTDSPRRSQPLVQAQAGQLDLRRRFKWHEALIQLLLFACGLLSIFTTIGIILVLGNESIAFFTRDQWVNSNRAILSDMDESATSARIQPGKALAAIAESDIIRIGQEVMEISKFHNNHVDIAVIGTGGGFARFCASEIALAEAGLRRPQIINASRAVKASEESACAEQGITPVGFRVGSDALAITVSADNDFISELSFAQLRQIFGEAERWSDVRPEYPDEPIQLVIPGTDSGSFDFFVEAVFDYDSEPILARQPILSENDEQLVGSIKRNPYAIGFFGYAYYLANAADLRILSLDGLAPSASAVEDGSYALARPLFLYSDAEIMRAEPQVADFISYSLANVNAVIVDVGYFQASVDKLAAARNQWIRATNASQAPAIDPATVFGKINMAGSSTVYPLSKRIADQFTDAGYLPMIEVRRGIRGENTIAPHSAGVAVEYNDQPTVSEFFTNTSWIPAIGEFGVIPLINATLMTSTIAMLVALPLGIGAAIYLSEYASPRVRNIIKPVLEVLAGIPTVVYGYFALTFMTPLLRAVFGVEVVNIYNTGSAGIVVGILIIPLISSMSEDALHAVPQALREASYGLGATKLETVIQVVMPAALSGILAAFIVAVSRAIGETMIVAIAAGAGPNFSFNPFDSAETMTGHIARISGGDLSYDSIDYNSIFAIGLTLFVMTFLLNALSRVVISRFREVY